MPLCWQESSFRTIHLKRMWDKSASRPHVRPTCSCCEVPCCVDLLTGFRVPAGAPVSDDNLCVICQDEEATCGFLHGSSVHKCACKCGFCIKAQDTMLHHCQPRTCSVKFALDQPPPFQTEMTTWVGAEYLKSW